MIIDFHVHIFPPEMVKQRDQYRQLDNYFDLLYANPKATMATAEDVITAMDEAGVDKAVVFGFSWCDAELCVDTNDYTIDAMRRYPDRLIGFASVYPADPARAVREIQRGVEAGMRGIGELMPDGQRFSLDDTALMAPIVDVANALSIPIMTHASEPVGHDYCGKGSVSPATLARFAGQFPQAQLVCSHWGGGLPFYELMPEVRRLMANVYYDTAASRFLYDGQIFPTLYPLVGKKILFGTDYALLHPRRCLSQIRESGLDDVALRDVLGGNASRLLGLAPAE